MDVGGFNWTLIAIVGVLLLAVILWAMLRNRGSAGIEDTEEATRRLYDEEEREHHGESDYVP